MRCGVGCRRGLDLALLWLWRRPGAVAPIRFLAWETPYAMDAALKKKKKKKRTDQYIDYFTFTEIPFIFTVNYSVPGTGLGT